MAWERQEPHRHAGSGAQEANGEGRDQGRDRGRPASPAGSPRARPEHAGYVHRVNPREAPTGCLRTNPRSEARAHLRKLRLQCSEPEPKRVLRAEGALRCFSETARSKSRSRAPPAALRGRSPRGRRLGGRAPPATSPERWGRSWASRPSCCAVAARALTPIHSDSAPKPPARASGAFFEWRAGQGVGAARTPQGRGHGPLTRPERPKPAGRVSGALFPGTPALGERPPAGPPEALVRRAVQGAPPAGVPRARSPLGLAQRTKPSAEGRHFLLFELRSSVSSRPPEGGLNHRDRRGTPESHE